MDFKKAITHLPPYFNKELFVTNKPFKQAKVESYPLFFNRYNDEYFFVVKDDYGEDILYLHALNIEGLQECFSEDVIMIDILWYTNTQYQNRGFATALHLTLHNQGFVIISNTNPSYLIRSVWKNLKYGSLMDIHTKQITKEESEILEPDKVFCFLPLVENEKSIRANNYWLQERHMYIDEQPIP